MSAQQQYLIAGIDLESLSSVTKAQLMSVLNGANLASNIGLVITSPLASPTGTEQARFLYLDTTTGNVKYWDGAAWSFAKASIGTGSIVNASITTPGAVPDSTNGISLDKIKGNASDNFNQSNEIVMMNASGNRLTTETIDNIISTYLSSNAVALSKISVTGASADYVLKYSGGVSTWGPVTGAMIPAGSIDSTKLATNAVTNTAIYDGSVTETKLGALCVTDAKVSTAAKVAINQYGITMSTRTAAVPTVDGVTTFTHGLGEMPSFVRVSLKCTSADLNYAVDEEVEWSASFGASFEPAPSVYVTSTVVKLGYTAWSTGGGWLYLHNATTGATTKLTAAKWTIVVRSFLLKYPTVV